MKIVNLTQHKATPEQVKAGVVDLLPEDRVALARLLTFSELPSYQDIEERALDIVQLAKQYEADAYMIGGAPFLMAPLEKALKAKGLKVVYAFSRRESVEKVMPDGSVVKTQVFKHLGFIEV